MSHAHHFLERLDRVTREQTEFALELYRDHEAVAYVLEHVNLPDGAPRVALAVDESADSPVVLVTREGRFVTCLGAGMRHEHPQIPYGQLKALLAKVEDKRARRELVQRELRPDEEEGELLHRVFTRGFRLAREDFLVVSAFEPLLGGGPFMAMMDVGADAAKGRAVLSIHATKTVVNGASRKMLEKLDRLEWATGHLALLSGAADRKQLDKVLELGKNVRASATFPCSGQAGSTFYLRAAWMVARFGKALIPAYKAAFVASTEWMTILDAAMGLAAIAARHSATAAEVRRIFEGYVPQAPDSLEPDAIRSNCAAVMLDVLSHADDRTDYALKVGRAVAIAWSSRLPHGHPRRYATEEEVPEDIARTAVLAYDGNMFDNKVQTITVSALPLAARAAAEEFYLPRELVRTWFGQWKPDEALARLRRWVDSVPKPIPFQAERTPGRNDPCTCGSGKKWKKCHGATASVS